MKDSRRDSIDRLHHMLLAMDEIEKFTANRFLEDFMEDSLLFSGVLFQFTVIGEAVKSIDNEILEKYDYPWYKVRAFRNLIAHEYFNIKLTAVWEIVLNDLPALKRTVNSIIKAEC